MRDHGEPSRTKAVMRSLVQHTPQSGTLPAALRVGVTVALPLALLVATGRTELALYATFGAFAAVYGRRPDGSADPRVQVRMAVVMVSSVATGVVVAASDARTWLGVVATAVWAALATYLSQRQGWRPPGPLFVVFAVGACSAVPVASAGEIGVAVATAAATATFGVLLTVASGPLIRRIEHERRRRRDGRRDASAGPAAHGATPIPPPPVPARQRRLDVTGSAAAAGLAGAAGAALTGDHPYWASVAAVAPLSAATPSSRLLKAMHRVLGTVGGLVVAGVLLSLPLGSAGTVAVTAVLQVLAELLIVRHYGAAMLVITPLALIVGQLAHPRPVMALLADRGVETLLGVAVAVVVVLLTRPREPTPAR